MTIGDATITVHHLIGDRAVQEAISAVSTEEVRKCTDDMRRYLRDGNPTQAALAEARAQTWESVLPVLKGYGEKYQPA